MKLSFFSLIAADCLSYDVASRYHLQTNNWVATTLQTNNELNKVVQDLP
jgi:hypothetical protein